MAAKSAFQIEIPRRAHACCECEQEFLPATEYHSAITEVEPDPESESQTEEGESQRFDYCPACWEKLGCPANGRTHWRGKMPKKREKKEPVNRDDQAFELLRAALDGDDDASRSEAFVLALFLARRKVLAMRKEKLRDGRLYQLYEEPATGVMIPVPKVELSQLEVESIQRSIAYKLRQPA